MFLLTAPGRAAIERYLEDQRDRPFTYAEVGASRLTPPPNYKVDHNRVLLGTGRKTFSQAVAAVKSWKMFDMPWVELCWADAPIAEGTAVAILIRHLGFFSLNAARIIYVVEERGDVEKFGFAYGTLPGHAERGEERFVVEHHRGSDEVWYDLFCFSRPRSKLAWAGYPITRRLQRRFASQSKQAMVEAVGNGRAD